MLGKFLSSGVAPSDALQMDGSPSYTYLFAKIIRHAEIVNNAATANNTTNNKNRQQHHHQQQPPTANNNNNNRQQQHHQQQQPTTDNRQQEQLDPESEDTHTYPLDDDILIPLQPCCSVSIPGIEHSF
jgi:hypothetical protein